jgi:hypothetical protein
MIDYSAYPHIVDLIWRYADTDTLWAARNSCRDLRKVADKLLVDTVPSTTLPPTGFQRRQERGLRRHAYGSLVDSHLGSTRALWLSWECTNWPKDDLLNLVHIACLIKERPNVELVVMNRQKPLATGTTVVGEVQPMLSKTLCESHPNTYTVHHVTVSDAVPTGVLAVPVAYGGGPVLVKLSLGRHDYFVLDSLRNCQVNGLELGREHDKSFIFFLCPKTAKHALWIKELEKPFLRAIVEQLVHGSNAQYTFVRSELPSAASLLSKGQHPLLEEVTAQLEAWKDAPGIDRLWERVAAQVHVITFEDLQSKVTPRVWDQVVGGPIVESKDLVYEPDTTPSSQGEYRYLPYQGRTRRVRGVSISLRL